MNKDDSDWDANQGADTPGESQSQGISKHSSPGKETLMETLTEPLAELPHEDAVSEAAVGPGSQDVVQLHMGDDDLD